jgi:hypothetical protein
MISSKNFVKIPTSGGGDWRGDRGPDKDLYTPRWKNPYYDDSHRWVVDHQARQTQARAQQVEDDSSAGGIAGGDNSSSVSELARFLTRRRYTKETVELITRKLNITQVWQLGNVSKANLDDVCKHLKLAQSKRLQNDVRWSCSQFEGKSHEWSGDMPDHHGLHN